MKPTRTIEQERALAHHALTLDDTLAAAYRLLGQVYLLNRQYEQAMAEVQRAIVCDPNWANAFMELGVMLLFVGQPQESVRSNARHAG